VQAAGRINQKEKWSADREASIGGWQEKLAAFGGPPDSPYTKLRDAVITHLTVAEGLGPLFASVPALS
jgi:hypothetical protein